jgi:transcriptional regulator with XRE-family HTH domain
LPGRSSRNTSLRQFGLRLRELRRAAGLSQEALADAAGLDRSYVGGVERGERNISLRNMSRLAKALKVVLKDLVEGVS